MSPSKLHEWVNATPERARIYAQESLIVDATEEIWEVLAQEKLTKADLAGRLGKSKAFVTQLLSGSRNMTLRTLADVASTLGRKVCVQLRRQGEEDHWEKTEAAFVGRRQIVSVFEAEGSNDSDWQSLLHPKKAA